MYQQQKKEKIFPPTTWHPFMSENNRAWWKTTGSDRENDSSLAPSLTLSLPLFFYLAALAHPVHKNTAYRNIDGNLVFNTRSPQFQESMAKVHGINTGSVLLFSRFMLVMHFFYFYKITRRNEEKQHGRRNPSYYRRQLEQRCEAIGETRIIAG